MQSLVKSNRGGKSEAAAVSSDGAWSESASVQPIDPVPGVLRTKLTPPAGDAQRLKKWKGGTTEKSAGGRSWMKKTGQRVWFPWQKWIIMIIRLRARLKVATVESNPQLFQISILPDLL